MLTLDDARWAELKHAYGPAGDVPAMLRAAQSDDNDARDQAWFDLWSALAHQSDVHTASYAAAPHLVEIANADADEASQALHLLGAIEAYRHKSISPAVPDFLQTAYDDAVRAAGSIALDLLARDMDEEETRMLLGVLAIVRGHARMGMAILDMEPEVECPECEHVFSPPGWDLNEAPDDD